MKLADKILKSKMIQKSIVKLSERFKIFLSFKNETGTSFNMFETFRSLI